MTSKQHKALLEAFYAYNREHTKTNDSLDFNAFKLIMEDWEVFPVTTLGKINGAVLVKDNEIHVAVNGTWFPRKYIKTILYPLVEKYKEVTTSVMKYNKSGLDWVMKLGFKITGVTSEETFLVLREEDLWVA